MGKIMNNLIDPLRLFTKDKEPAPAAAPVVADPKATAAAESDKAARAFADDEEKRRLALRRATPGGATALASANSDTLGG
jgi:hypothetical protein